MSNKVAFMFPGQGSQFVGMGKALHEAFPAAREVFGVADEALGFELSTLCFSGDLEELTRTENTQPALLTVSVAVQRVLASRGVVPGVLAGHSLGEYSALVAAGSIDLADAVRLVRSRGAYMQQAVPEGAGAMAAILGLDDAAVVQACALAREGHADEVVEPANFNAPSQVVIAGHTAAVERACQHAKALGAKRAVTLAVSAPFHSSLLEPAGRRLAQALASVSIRAPRMALVNNVDAAVEVEPQRIVDALVRQSYSPVRWVEVVRKLRALGATRVIEFGPGKVLAGLVGRIDRELAVNAVYDPATLRAALEEAAK